MCVCVGVGGRWGQGGVTVMLTQGLGITVVSALLYNEDMHLTLGYNSLGSAWVSKYTRSLHISSDSSVVL